MIGLVDIARWAQRGYFRTGPTAGEVAESSLGEEETLSLYAVQFLLDYRPQIELGFNCCRRATAVERDRCHRYGNGARSDADTGLAQVSHRTRTRQPSSAH
jgi:hypothetical protein